MLYNRFYAKSFFLILACFFSIFINQIRAQVIFPTAGNGESIGTVGYWGDNGLALDASTSYPSGICFDTSGNMYLTCVNSIRKIDVNTGIITLVAGNGTYASSGDEGSSLNASMKFPYALCSDKRNNIFVSEYAGHRIRKINLATGIISTVAGNGTQGSNGDGGLAKNAQLNTPQGICVDDNDNLYIADFNNSKIRRVNLSTGIITTLASFDHPNSLCIDSHRNLFISLTTTVIKYNLTTNVSSIVAGNGTYAYSGDGGLATNAALFDVSGLGVDSSGNLYISEYDDSRIRKVDFQTGNISTIAGNGTNGYGGDCGLPINASLHSPKSLALDKFENLYVCDNRNNRIRQINQVNPQLPSISISCADSNLYHGVPVVITADYKNAGFNVGFRWSKNHTTLNTSSSSFATTLEAGDTISCTLFGRTPCLGSYNVTSNIILKPYGICAQGDTIFTSSIEGSNYKWQVNSGNGFEDIIDTARYSGTSSRDLKVTSIDTSMYQYKYRCRIDTSFGSECGFKFASYWNGNFDSEWENPLNWDCGYVPDQKDDVIIRTGNVIINSHAVCRSIRLFQGASLTITSNFSLITVPTH